MTTDVVSFPSGACVRDVVATFVSGRRQLRDRQHRQRLYPVVDDAAVMHGVVTRRDVLDVALADVAPTDGSRSGRIEDLMVADPVVAHPDETLRTVANRMAASGCTRMPVVERGSGRVVGLVSLAQLLQGRLKDLQEAREAEQVLRFRLVLPTLRVARRGAVRRPIAHESPSKEASRR
jgi:CBS domain-containing protein